MTNEFNVGDVVELKGHGARGIVVRVGSEPYRRHFGFTPVYVVWTNALAASIPDRVPSGKLALIPRPQKDYSSQLDNIEVAPADPT